MPDQIITEVQDAVLTITLNRPDRLNAWTQTMARELIEAFDAADADDEVRVIIVTGAGRAFCAGADLERGGETFDARARAADSGGTPRLASIATTAVSSRCGSSSRPSR